MPNVVGLVYLAGPALDEGESLMSLLARWASPQWKSDIRKDKYGFLWIPPEKFREIFRHDLDETESLILALTQKPTAARCFEEESEAAAVESEAQLVSDLGLRPDDPSGDRRVDGKTNRREKDNQPANQSRVADNSPQ